MMQGDRASGRAFETRHRHAHDGAQHHHETLTRELPPLHKQAARAARGTVTKFAFERPDRRSGFAGVKQCGATPKVGA